MLQEFDLIVVGAGFWGLTIAERTANELGLKVAVIEKRNHIGGNAYSYIDSETGIEIHKYGSHLFHTNSPEVWSYVNRFDNFTSYRHFVHTNHGNKIYSMPINLSTICSFFGKHFTPEQARALINEQAAEYRNQHPQNFEEKAISLIGRPLYEAFIRGYTAKQWQTDPTLLPASLITRLPVRFTFDQRYFNDVYEGLPAKGYCHLFERMITSPNISLLTETDFFEIRENIPPKMPIVYSGPIDKFFNFQLGVLGWRTLDFQEELLHVPDFQGTAVMNYADEAVPFTRIHEFKHLHPERSYESNQTIIFREYSRFANKIDDPYYPINTSSDQKIYDEYQKMGTRLETTLFGGRLGTYRYLDMHQAIGAALKCFQNYIIPWFRDGKDFCFMR